MADQEINFILNAVDNASYAFQEAASNFSASAAQIQEDAKGLEMALAGVGLAAGTFLTLAAKSTMDEEQAITDAARATRDMAGGYDRAREGIAATVTELEMQGFAAQDTADAITVLVTKGGRDLPTAMAEAADFMAFAEARHLSLQKAIRLTTDTEENSAISFEGAAAKRMATLTTSEKLAITMEKVDNLMQRIGDRLVPVIEAGIIFVDGLLDGFDRLDPGMQNTLVVLTLIGAAIATVVGAVAAFVMVMAPVVASINAIMVSLGVAGGIIGAFNAALGAAAAVIGAIFASVAAAVLAIVAIGVLAIVAYFQNWFGLQDAWMAMLFALRDTIYAVFEAIVQILFWASETWTGVTQGMAIASVNMGIQIGTAIRNLIIDITNQFTALIGQALQWGKDLVDNILSGIAEKADEFAAAAADVASAGWNLLTGGATGLVSTGVRPLAEGGIITSPTLAVLGEGGENEYVIPESKMKGWMGGGKNVNITQNFYGATDPERTAQLSAKYIMGALSASNGDAMVSSRVGA